MAVLEPDRFVRADRRFRYELLAGLAIRDYRADVDLEPAGEGTDIR